jgi:isochorismate synthase
VPFAPLSSFLSAVPREFSFVWSNPPSGVDCVGGGTAHRIQLSGHDRLPQLHHQSTALWARIRSVRHPEAPAYSPRLFGGLAFSAGNSRRLPWREFGDGAFTLARWTYGRRGAKCFLSLAVRSDEGPKPRRRRQVLTELERILDVLFADRERARQRATEADAALAESIRQLPVAEWKKHIRKIHEAIAEKRFLKIVAARRCDLTLSFPSNDIDVVNRLMTEPRCTHFAFRRKQSSFLGATPELLFTKSGLDLRTQALAGTGRSREIGVRRHSRQSAQLLGSQKDRAEHEFVVKAIRNALAPLCTEVALADRPDVVALRNILHINTPFKATVRPTTSVTDLLEALHPTPAVGGVPGHAAREWITEHEREERGWYTGPVGWFNAQGSAEFAVAIRCGVVRGTRAHIYTGAGVVRESDYGAEYVETALKQQAMLRALGVVVRS